MAAVVSSDGALPGKLLSRRRLVAGHAIHATTTQATDLGAANRRQGLCWLELLQDIAIHDRDVYAWLHVD